MVLLRQEDVELIAPQVGRVVLCFAEFEGVLDDLDRAVDAALAKARPELPPRKPQSKLAGKLDRVVAGLALLGAGELAESLDDEKERIVAVANDRHHVVHGRWWWHYAEGTINTAKPSLTTKQVEHREWNAENLQELIDGIREIEHIVYVLDMKVREKWLEPDAYFAAEDDGIDPDEAA